MVEKNIKDDVSIVKMDNKYPNFPYAENSELKKCLEELFLGLGLSPENPFATYVKKGEITLIKPNWVRDKNPLGFSVESLITHSSIIKYLIDFVAVATDGEGKIIIADAPLQNCDFENLKKETKIEDVIKNAKLKYPNLEIIVEDWRLTKMKSSRSNEVDVQKIKKDESGYKLVDLKNDSFLEPISDLSQRFRVTKYKPSLLLKHHSKGKHEYLVTKRIFEADFIINLPKMKTHIKAGLTGAMKNLVGINGHKEFLPHHIKGSPVDGGDNYMTKNWFKSKYEDLYDYLWENINGMNVIKRKFIMKILQILLKISRIFGAENILAGSWYGNDTIWRTTLDLNHILYFNQSKRPKVLNIVDGIISGEGDGPLQPTPKNTGILVAGENPAYVDLVLAQMIGYDFVKLPTIYNAVRNKNSKFVGVSPDNFFVNFKDKDFKNVKLSELPNFKFKKPKFWDHI